MIKFKNHSKGNNIEYIKCSNIILPIKSIVYIEKNISRTYDSVRPNIYYTIYFWKKQEIFSLSIANLL